MNRIRASAYPLSLHAAAALILLRVLTQGNTDYTGTHALHPGLESGKWAVRFLLLSLTMTPLSTYFRWTKVIKLRKPAGLWAFGFSAVHVFYYLDEANWTWLDPTMPLYLALGVYGLGVFAALAATSNRWSMKRLGKNWKRLHRTVYSAGLAVAFHAIFAAGFSKKIAIFDPQAIPELRVYLVVMIALLTVRVPRVRVLLKGLASLTRALRPADIRMNGHNQTPARWSPDLPVERELSTPTEELWRSPDGAFVWSAARETEAWLQGNVATALSGDMVEKSDQAHALKA